MIMLSAVISIFIYLFVTATKVLFDLAMKMQGCIPLLKRMDRLLTLLIHNNGTLFQ